jgi:hypothetical protein
VRDGLFTGDQSLKVTDVSSPVRTAAPSPVPALAAAVTAVLALASCERGKPRQLPPDPMAVAPPADVAPVAASPVVPPAMSEPLAKEAR